MLTLAVAALTADPSPSAVASARGALVPLRRGELDFELYLPAAWEERRTRRWPTIVFLHGRGESGGFDVTNAQSLPWQLVRGNNASCAAAGENSGCGFVVIVPQCPRMCAMINHWSTPTLQRVAALVQDWAIPTLGTDPHRVYLAGQSMGGHGAWIFAVQQPRLFAAVVVVCGYAQGGDEEAEIAERLAKQDLAVSVYHSADDSVIPVAAGDAMVEAVRRAAAAASTTAPRYVRYEHAPGPPMEEFAHLIGHGSYELAFRDPALYAWLLGQSCRKCDRPLPPWRPLAGYENDGGDNGASRRKFGRPE